MDYVANWNLHLSVFTLNIYSHMLQLEHVMTIFSVNNCCKHTSYDLFLKVDFSTVS